jgi:CBS domain-containing protein
MTSEVITTARDAPLTEAPHPTDERKIGCLPVVETGHLVAIITEGDFIAPATRKDCVMRIRGEAPTPSSTCIIS